jgi:hypothetical protein
MVMVFWFLLNNREQDTMTTKKGLSSIFDEETINKILSLRREKKISSSLTIMSWEEWKKLKGCLSGFAVGGTAFISQSEMKEKNLNSNNF